MDKLKITRIIKSYYELLQNKDHRNLLVVILSEAKELGRFKVFNERRTTN